MCRFIRSLRSLQPSNLWPKLCSANQRIVMYSLHMYTNRSYNPLQLDSQEDPCYHLLKNSRNRRCQDVKSPILLLLIVCMWSYNGWSYNGWSQWTEYRRAGLMVVAVLWDYMLHGIQCVKQIHHTFNFQVFMAPSVWVMPWAPAATLLCRWNPTCLHPRPQPRALSLSVSVVFSEVQTYKNCCLVKSHPDHVFSNFSNGHFYLTYNTTCSHRRV